MGSSLWRGEGRALVWVWVLMLVLVLAWVLMLVLVWVIGSGLTTRDIADASCGLNTHARLLLALLQFDQTFGPTTHTQLAHHHDTDSRPPCPTTGPVGTPPGPPLHCHYTRVAQQSLC